MLLDASPIFMTLCCACIFAFLFANKKQNKKQHFYYSWLSHTVNNKYNYVSTLNLKFAQCVHLPIIFLLAFSFYIWVDDPQLKKMEWQIFNWYLYICGKSVNQFTSLLFSFAIFHLYILLDISNHE